MDWLDIVGFMSQVLVCIGALVAFLWNWKRKEWKAKGAVAFVALWMLILLGLEAADNWFHIDPMDALSFRILLLAVCTTGLSVIVLLTHGWRAFVFSLFCSCIFSVTITWRLGVFSPVRQVWGLQSLCLTLVSLLLFGLFFCALLIETIEDMSQASAKRHLKRSTPTSNAEGTDGS